MKYINAADILPQELLEEITRYASGKLLYVPSLHEKSSWGERSGSKKYYRERNQKIKELFQQGQSMDDLAETFYLSNETIRKIIHTKNWIKKKCNRRAYVLLFVWVKLVITILNLEVSYSDYIFWLYNLTFWRRMYECFLWYPLHGKSSVVLLDFV